MLLAGGAIVCLLAVANTATDALQMKFMPIRQALRLPAHTNPLQVPDALDAFRVSRDAVQSVVEKIPGPNGTSDPGLAGIEDPIPPSAPGEDHKPVHKRKYSGPPSTRPGIHPRPASGTLLMAPQDAEGTGTLTIESQIGSDATVTLVRKSRPNVAVQRVYVRGNETAVLSGITTGVYAAVASLQASPEIKKGRGRNDVPTNVQLGTFQFLQVVSAQGTQSDEYHVVIKPR